jgi:hypothetical protein
MVSAISWIEQTGALPVSLPLTSQVQTRVRTGSFAASSRTFSTMITAPSGQTLMHSPQLVILLFLRRFAHGHIDTI